MGETSKVTFIAEVEVEHPTKLSNEEVVRLTFKLFCQDEGVSILDVMVQRDVDED